MNKATALLLLGGTVKAAAALCRISPSAVSQWPEELTKDQVDRVQAALYRSRLNGKEGKEGSLSPAKTQAA